MSPVATSAWNALPVIFPSRRSSSAEAMRKWATEDTGKSPDKTHRVSFSSNLVSMLVSTSGKQPLITSTPEQPATVPEHDAAVSIAPASDHIDPEGDLDTELHFWDAVLPQKPMNRSRSTKSVESEKSVILFNADVDRVATEEDQKTEPQGQPSKFMEHLHTAPSPEDGEKPATSDANEKEATSDLNEQGNSPATTTLGELETLLGIVARGIAAFVACGTRKTKDKTTEDEKMEAKKTNDKEAEDQKTKEAVVAPEVEATA